MDGLSCPRQEIVRCLGRNIPPMAKVKAITTSSVSLLRVFRRQIRGRIDPEAKNNAASDRLYQKVNGYKSRGQGLRSWKITTTHSVSSTYYVQDSRTTHRRCNHSSNHRLPSINHARNHHIYHYRGTSSNTQEAKSTSSCLDESWYFEGSLSAP